MLQSLPLIVVLLAAVPLKYRPVRIVQIPSVLTIRKTPVRLVIANQLPIAGNTGKLV